MAKENRIRDFFPVDSIPRVLVQARISKTLRDEVKASLKKEGRNWEELITASFEKFLEEGKKRK